MTGPEHYREAERELGTARRLRAALHSNDTEDAAISIASAQVHATLALAAATGDFFMRAGQTAKDAWRDVLALPGGDSDG